jgi:hypothetical protein
MPGGVSRLSKVLVGPSICHDYERVAIPKSVTLHFVSVVSALLAHCRIQPDNLDIGYPTTLL